MRPARRPSPRLIAPLFAAAAALASAPVANAQFFGLYPDGGPGAVASKPAGSSGAGWFGLRADAGVAPASHVAAPPSAVQPASYGLVPDGSGGHAGATEPVYPPGGRQKESAGLLWPPYPRSTAPEASLKTQLHHAHYWPLPYSCRDRAYVRALSAAQVAAGRAEHAALHGFHFDPVTNLLTSAGRDHLQTEALAAASSGTVVPIVVAGGADRETAFARVAAVRTAVSEMGAPQLAGAVSLGMRPANGRPAEEIDRLRSDELQSTPQPRIPVSTSGSASSSPGT
ncbi:hypothetical protein LzC2_41720 [Planctomycetes bacterium LzC2]|uniref:Uncharacterized protein n=1 Tax=Alienimonas chondri TaxID=2681879 RepID=A0ABX1VIZ0_9PLAN|nr:hypothetical protein [Alienimonas chondri]